MVSEYKIKYLIFISVAALTAVLFLAFGMSRAASESSEKNNVSKSKIEDLKAQIEFYQAQIDEKREKEESVSNDIEIIEADIKKIELQVQQTQLEIESLEASITGKESEIALLEKQIQAQGEMLGKFLQELYEKAEFEETEIVFGRQSFSDYFAGVESLKNFEDQITEVHNQLEATQEELESQKETLVAGRVEKETLRGIQEDQNRSLETEKQMENLIIAKLRNETAALEENVSALRAELNNLQSTGDPINLEEAIEAAKYASKITGVAPEFLLGVLRVESALGTNVGGGKYKTDMNPNQWDNFKIICKELKLDPAKMPVSRRVCYNKKSSDGCGGWGGAMGPAQFMPSTWVGYKEKVEKATGRKPANPWDLKDSLVAMGLKLASVDGVTSGNRKAWAKAAGMYLAGSNWEKYSWYSDRVLYYADGFKKIMKKK